MSGISEIQGYKTLPLKIHPNVSNICHTIFAKEHFIRVTDAEKPKGRTLFLLNVPPYVTKDHLMIFYNKIGVVHNILFSEKPGKDECTKKLNEHDTFSLTSYPFIFKVAYVIFKSTSSLQAALQLSAIELYDKKTKKSYVECGIEKWTKNYFNNIQSDDKLKNEIDLIMEQYDEKERQTIEAAKSTEADNDGWITVGKHSKNAGFQQKNVNKLEKSQKSKELKNFYTFQLRQQKMQTIVNLRKKFEDDVVKIKTLKKTRRFNPF